MKQKKIRLFNLCCLLGLLALSDGQAQNENNIWNINQGRVLDFNTIPPSLIDIDTISSLIFSSTPPVSVADSLGNLLFYSNGRFVVNKNYEIMPNSRQMRGGVPLSGQVVIPFYNNKNKYHLFYLSGGFANLTSYNPGVLYHAVIDMSLDNGNGDVIVDQRDSLITDNLTGRLAVAQGTCGAMWLIVHELENNRFLTYEVIGDKIKSPVISEEGTRLNGFYNEKFLSFGRGMMKISSDFKRLALFGGEDEVVELFSFNNVTGKITNPVSLPVAESTVFIPTGSFSPDNSKLYVLETNEGRNVSTYFQYNLDVLTFQEMLDSKTLISSTTGETNFANMEIGPNDVIYVNEANAFMSAILKPNISCPACEFEDSTYIFNGMGGSDGTSFTLHAPMILPTIPIKTDSLLLPFDQELCQNTQLSLQIQAEGDTYRWQDGTTTKDYEITAPGTYWVEVQKGNCTFTDTLKILPDESLVELGKDTTLCQDEVLMIEVAAEDGNRYEWQDGSTNPNLTISRAGLYWVESTDSLCSYRDSILVEIEEIAIALPEDTVLCPNQNLFLNVAQTGVDYEWQDGSTQATFSVSAAGLYWVEAQKGRCRIRDSLIVSIREEALFLPNDTTLCNVTDYLIIPDTSFKNIIWWQSPSSGDSLLVTESGTYHALPVDNNCFYDSVTVTFQEVKLVLPPDTTLCMETDFLLDVGTIEGQLTWQDGSTDQQFLVTQSGTYWANLTKDNCTASDSIEVSIAPLTVDLGQDTTLCENESLALTINIPNGNYEWQDGSQAQNYTVTEAGIYWAKIIKDNCVTIDSILVNFTSPPTIDLGVDTTLCIAETLTLIAPTILTNYQWQDGAINNPQLVSTSGNYWLEGAIDNCIVRDSIFVTFEACPDDTQFCQAYLPNSFSPNGDGINDGLQLLTDCELQFFEMEVYDRWGNLVFATTDIRQAWDGTVNGELLDTGVYLWTVRYQFLEQDFLMEKVETVTVLR